MVSTSLHHRSLRTRLELSLLPVNSVAALVLTLSYLSLSQSVHLGVIVTSSLMRFYKCLSSPVRPQGRPTVSKVCQKCHSRLPSSAKLPPLFESLVLGARRKWDFSSTSTVGELCEGSAAGTQTCRQTGGRRQDTRGGGVSGQTDKLFRTDTEFRYRQTKKFRTYRKEDPYRQIRCCIDKEKRFLREK